MLRAQLRMTQEQFSEHCEISRASVARYEAGEKLDRKNAEKIASACGTTVDFILGYGPTPMNLTEAFIIKRGQIPIIGEIACGTPITAQQNIEGFADAPDCIHADFALKCKGNSMNPTFEDGDLVLVRIQPDVEDGQIAVVLISGEATLKRVYHQDKEILLVADNPSYSPIRFQLNNDNPVAIQGLAVGFTRMFYK